MKISVPVVFALLFLSACTTTKPIIRDESKFIIPQPPKALLNCPSAPKVPNSSTLTNSQIASYIDRLYKAHQTCKINMDQLTRYFEEIKKLNGI